jgi:hypothetical protein
MAPERPASGTDSRHYPQERGARFAERLWTFHGNAPHDAPPSLSHLEASRAVLGLAAAARGVTRRADAAGVGSMCLLDVPIDMQAC